MPKQITLKESKSIDIALLKELYQHAPWAKDRSLADIKRALAQSTLVISAWERDLLVGFARVLSDKVFRATIWDVIVRPDYQQEGIGSMIVEKIIAHPSLRNVDRFWLNTKQPEFYKKFGFVPSQEAMLLARKTRIP
ncbi:MAG: GNAT family N-acetyltransferase [Nitrospirae bacterium]|nr:GNAT family N-acetyltransferase [Nitrospirota bacterium]MBI3594719.1 GNAT family N-acetyltransferase [Nitrospirota bacterium]